MATNNLLKQLFQAELRQLTPEHQRLTQRYEVFYHINDFVAGLLFTVGSVLFFWESTQFPATWMFVIGSVLFTLRPAINVLRDLHLRRLPLQDIQNSSGPTSDGDTTG